MEIAVEFNNAFKSKTSTSVCRSTILESVDVVLDCLNWDAHLGCTFSKEHGIVDTLSSRCNFLASHEEVIRVCVVAVMRIDHSVEWTGVFGVAVKHVEISIIFLPHNFSEGFFCFSGEIF